MCACLVTQIDELLMVDDECIVCACLATQIDEVLMDDDECIVCAYLVTQIDEVLMDDEKCEALVSHVDQLLITCTLQLRVTYSKHMSLHLDSSSTGGSTLQQDVLSLYKCLLATLLSVSCLMHVTLSAISCCYLSVH